MVSSAAVDASSIGDMGRREPVLSQSSSQVCERIRALGRFRASEQSHVQLPGTSVELTRACDVVGGHMVMVGFVSENGREGLWGEIVAPHFNTYDKHKFKSGRCRDDE